VPEEVPSKLKPLVAAFQDTSKQTTAATAAVAAAFQDYDKLMDPSNPQQAPPVFAARLNGALNTLTASHATVSGYVKARQGLVAELEALLAASKAELDKDEEKLAQLAQRKDEIFSKKHEVEMEIMRGLDEPAGAGASSTTPTTAAPGADAAAVSASMDAAPEVEALTPPSMHGNDEDEEDEYEPAPEMETLDIVDQEMVAQETVDQETAEPSRKRRRIEADPVPVANDDATDEAFPDLGQDDGIDADVADMLRGGNAT
jgi:regulator of Ty1 transposition protein 103